jgi:hypothetical protein
MSNPHEMSSRLVGTGGACSTIARPFVLAGSAYFNEFMGTDGARQRCLSREYAERVLRAAQRRSHFARNTPMRFDYKGFHIDCRSRHDQDGRYYAQARVIRIPTTADAHPEKHESGDIDAFDNDGDAIACARAWALDWCHEHEA